MDHLIIKQWDIQPHADLDNFVPYFWAPLYQDTSVYGECGMDYMTNFLTR